MDQPDEQPTPDAEVPRMLRHAQELAAAKGYKAHHIAEATGVALSAVQRMMKRRRSPLLKNLEAITDFLENAPAKAGARRNQKGSQHEQPENQG